MSEQKYVNKRKSSETKIKQKRFKNKRRRSDMSTDEIVAFVKRTKIPKWMRKAVYEEYNMICANCGKICHDEKIIQGEYDEDFLDAKATIDHIIAWSLLGIEEKKNHGGIENLQLLCYPCNWSKSNSIWED